MDKIQHNKEAWSLLSLDHYQTFKKRLQEEETILNQVIIDELGDIKGKRILHLQCNTGADSICLARLGAEVVGVDLSESNVYYATKLAEEFQAPCRFIASDVLRLDEVLDETFDVVFTSEGAIGWLPDLTAWAKIIRTFLRQDGFFYMNEAHPFMMMFDEELFIEQKLEVKYPYFIKEPEENIDIGGYASESKVGKNYYWMYSIGEVLNALIGAGLHVEFFHEFDTICYNMGNMERVATARWRIPAYKDKIPMHFSLKASVYPIKSKRVDGC